MNVGQNIDIKGSSKIPETEGSTCLTELSMESKDWSEILCIMQNRDGAVDYQAQRLAEKSVYRGLLI